MPSAVEYTQTWWKSAIVYQIYPVSFFDSNGDGIGDLPGISLKLDYLKSLGVDVLWLSPIYRSPQADMGYDISDYRDIDPKYGTLEDWDRLLQGVHERGMKLMMDLVVNHTSNEHEWFLQSKSTKSSPKRDWYIWRPPKYDSEGNRQPPNNWRAAFQGSVWEYDPPTDEYYLHLYLAQQPDLNWENPEVRAAIWDLMRFWVNRGCDGFRMDVINLISKVEGLPDAPVVNPDEIYQPSTMFWANGPRVHDYLKEMNKEILSHHDLITVGETPFSNSASELGEYVLPANRELQMVFHFELSDIDCAKAKDRTPLIPRDWKLSEMREIMGKWQTYKRDDGFWNAVFIENHDFARSVSRFGNDSTPELRSLSAKLLAMLQIMQSGTLYVYQGEELGLKNFPRSWGIEEYKDIASQNYWKRVLERRERESRGKDVDMSDVLDGMQRKARDHSRTPMQWNASSHAGFTAGTPWMRVNEDYKTWNAAEQVTDDESVFSFWKKAIRVRKAHDVLTYGEFHDLCPKNEQVFAVMKSLSTKTALVLLNFSNEEVSIPLDDIVNGGHLQLVLGNYSQSPDTGLASETVVLRNYEGRIYVEG